MLLGTDKERTRNGQGTDIYVDKVNFSVYNYNIGDNIDMNTEKLLELKSKGEGLYLEFKSCENNLSQSIFETISSFSNRLGGYIILGINDADSEIKGVNKGAVERIKKNFINQMNDINIISPTLFLELKELEFEDKILLWVYVPISSVVVRYKGKIYDRIDEADIDISHAAILLDNLYRRKSNDDFEKKIFPYITLDDLRGDLIERVRILISNNFPNHRWLSMDNVNLFKSASLYGKNYTTNEEGYNLACVLLFGKDEVIKACCSGYTTDAIYRITGNERYNDREIIETNLIDIYYKLMDFVEKHTNDEFVLVNGVRKSARNIIAREIIANLLVHRDFSSNYPAKLLIDENSIKTQNWCLARRNGRILSEDFEPFPKNKIIANFFNVLGLSEGVGSGIINIFKYTSLISEDSIPFVHEAEIFNVEIPLSSKKDKVESEYKYEHLTERQISIMTLIKSNNYISIKDIAKEYGVSEKTVLRDIICIKKEFELFYSKEKKKWIIEQ